MKRIILCSLFLVSLLPLVKADEPLVIRLSDYAKKKIPIAITEFQDTGETREGLSDADRINLSLLSSLHTIVIKDLELTNWFKIIAEEAFIADLKKEGYGESDIKWNDWKAIESTHLVKGTYEFDTKTRDLIITAYLYSIPGKKILFKRSFTGKFYGSLPSVRKFAHKIANRIVEQVTGEMGIFDTRIAFIERKLEMKSDIERIKKPAKVLDTLKQQGSTEGKDSRNKEYIFSKEIMIMDFDGGNISPLTSNRTLSISPHWSRDGSLIVYTARNKKNGRWDMYVYDILKWQSQRLTSFEHWDVFSPNFSPQEDLIAATISKNDSDIYILNKEGKVLNQITSQWNIDISPSWSPDGKKIAFSSARTGKPQIYIMNWDGSNIERITFEGRHNDEPAWSPKGDKIAYRGQDIDGESDILIYDLKAKKSERMTYDTKDNEYPTWSPDGRFIAFHSSRTGMNQIFIINATGQAGSERKVTNCKYDCMSPNWSPRLK